MVAVSVGTWSLENLFSSGEFEALAAVYDRKLAGIAATVTGRGIDVLARRCPAVLSAVRRR